MPQIYGKTNMLYFCLKNHYALQFYWLYLLKIFVILVSKIYIYCLN